jgi:endonuclease/exonuclease/phosphatase (EEP) superfamily protein YafD
VGSPPVVVGISTSRDNPTSASAEVGWKPVVSGGSILADGRWFAGGKAGIGFAAVELGGDPPPVVVGVPDRTLRFGAYNIYHDYRGIARTIAEVRKLDPPPDFLFLEEIEPQNVRPWAEALKPQDTYYPSLGRQPDGTTLWPDTAILSRHRLFEGRPLQTDDGRTFGLWATAVVDGNKFAVAAVHLWPTWMIDPRHVAFTAQMRNKQLKTLIATWEQAGRPPLILGGDFNQPPVGENYGLMTSKFSDTLKSLGRDGGTFPLGPAEVRIDYLLATPDWAPKDGGVIKGDASDHRLVWVDVGRSHDRARSTTQAVQRPQHD